MKDDNYYIEAIRSRLSDYRFEHSINVAACAKKLAEHYGFSARDAAKLYTAGILHDILKDTPKPELKEYMKLYFPEATELELRTRKLWHAMAGSEFIRRELGVDDPDIISAVRWHTTGRAGMTPFDSILFIADFISDDRDYPGVETMREYAFSDFTAAVTEGLRFTIEDLAKRCKPVHPDTVAYYNEILLEGKQK